MQIVEDAKYYVIADFDAGYWQVKMNQASKEKTAFFIPNGKKHFDSMPIGATNTHVAFVAMVSKMELKWDKPYESRCKKAKEVEWEWQKEKMEASMVEMKCKQAKTKKHMDQEKVPYPKSASEAFEPVWQRPLKTGPIPGSAVIVDDIILFAPTVIVLLFYSMSFAW